ncbi:MAG: hypothetical protein WCL14_01145 [Bacteroidota bacterium]
MYPIGLFKPKNPKLIHGIDLFNAKNTKLIHGIDLFKPKNTKLIHGIGLFKVLDGFFWQRGWIWDNLSSPPLKKHTIYIGMFFLVEFLMIDYL